MAGRPTIRFDATLMDPDGHTLVEIEGMTLKRIDQTHRGVIDGTTDRDRPPRLGRAESDRPNLRVTMPTPGPFSNLELRSADRLPPGEGQVEIEVAAAGLNFKDVLRALGMLQGFADGDVAVGFGTECAGRIARVGPGVTGLEPGDEVMALAHNAMGAFATTIAKLVVPIPPALTFEQSATVREMFLAIAERFASGVYRLSPVQTFPIDDVAGAFELMASARTPGNGRPSRRRKASRPSAASWRRASRRSSCRPSRPFPCSTGARGLSTRHVRRLPRSRQSSFPARCVAQRRRSPDRDAGAESAPAPRAHVPVRAAEILV